MIKVSQAEAAEIRKHYPNSTIVRLMVKDTKRKHYRATLDRDVQFLLAKIRNTTVAEILKSEDY